MIDLASCIRRATDWALVGTYAPPPGISHKLSHDGLVYIGNASKSWRPR